MAQRNGRVDTCGTPRRKNRGHGRGHDQRSGWQQQAAKSEGLHLEQQRLDETRQIQSSEGAERDADERRAAGVRKHRSNDGQMPGAERYSYSDLPGPFEDGVTQDAIDADANEDESDAAKNPAISSNMRSRRTVCPTSTDCGVMALTRSSGLVA